MHDGPPIFRWARAGLWALLALACVSVSAGAIAAGVPEVPRLTLTGTIYASGSGLKSVLFKYRRTVVESGTLQRVVQSYDYPDGKPAARETIVYEGGKLVSFHLEELQTGGWGRARVEGEGGVERLILSYTSPDGEKDEDQEKLKPNTVINDMIPGFLLRHWTALMRGETVSSRFIAISRAETVGFEFEKVRNTSWEGRPAVVIRMKPSSFIIAALVDPLYFTVEAEGEHRVRSYSGRTTPKIRVDGKWQDLQAVTVFDF